MAFESFLPAELLVDLMVFAAVQAGLSRLCLKRLLWTLTADCAMTVLFYMLSPPGAVRAALQFPCFIFLAALLRGTRDLRNLLLTAACLFGSMAVSAGLLSAFPLTPQKKVTILASVAITSSILYYLLKTRRNSFHTWRVLIELEIAGRRCAFPALIDTGNTLRETYSRQAVMIVEQRILEKAHIRVDSGTGSACYAALGGSGELLCLHADSILIQTATGISVQAPSRWIAVYPTRIPGGRRALAPAAYADVLSAASDSQCIPSSLLRRLVYVVFQCPAVNLRSGCPNTQRECMLHRRQRHAARSAQTRGGNGIDPAHARRR